MNDEQAMYLVLFIFDEEQELTGVIPMIDWRSHVFKYQVAMQHVCKHYTNLPALKHQ